MTPKYCVKNCKTDISKHKAQTILFADTHHITLFTHIMLFCACIRTWFCDQTQWQADVSQRWNSQTPSHWQHTMIQQLLITSISTATAHYCAFN